LYTKTLNTFNVFNCIDDVPHVGTEKQKPVVERMARLEPFEGINGRASMRYREGKHDFMGLFYFYTKGQLNLIITPEAIRDFFNEDKNQVLRILELNQKALEKRLEETKEIYEAFPEVKTFKEDYESYKLHYELNKELLSKLKAEVRELTEVEEEEILDEIEAEVEEEVQEELENERFFLRNALFG